MFELIISRMSVFYLNYANSFIAIPLALFGLAIGSLRTHLSRQDPDDVNLALTLSLLALSSALSFNLVFLLFSRFLPITAPLTINWLSTLKTVLFVLIFLAPFYFIGRILTVLFYRNRRQIGRLYAADLFGASLAAFATPVLFHFLDLPYLVFVCLLGMSVVLILQFRAHRRALLAMCAAVNLFVLVALVVLEGNYEFSTALSLAPNETVREIAHRWNEFSRVSLLQIKRTDEPGTRYRIIHDNGESNVYLSPYSPTAAESDIADRRITLPVLLGRRVETVLVMFAGAGRQMIQYHEATYGAARVTGVELNPLVIDLAVKTPPVRHYRLAEFYDLPTVQMAVQEGRYFLETHADRYDTIFVASDAATSQIKTGHSRKYLDTLEAMRAYFDHLTDDGLILFHCIPSWPKLALLRRMAVEDGSTDLEDRVVLLSQNLGLCDFLAVSRQPFRPQELETIRRTWPTLIKYMPNNPGNDPQAVQAVRGEIATPLVTDDVPFIDRLDFAHYLPFPSAPLLRQMTYYRSWIKITTLGVIGLGLLAIVGGLYLRRAPMPPVGILLFLTATGFCYMLCEIAYIAKLELFMGNPLYSMSLLLTMFLLTNALGSRLHSRWHERLDMRLVPLAVGAIILATTVAINYVAAHWLGWPLAVKIVVAALLVSPTGIGLGLFYPYAVTWLTQHERSSAVPVTYAISTLSSVAGASYAMTMMVNWGYTNLLHQAVGGYGLVAALFWILGRRAR
jgi:hypothetical protein